MNQTHTISARTITAAVDRYAEHIAREQSEIRPLFIFSGGEPLLQKDLLFDAITMLDNRFAHLQPAYRIITNGTLLNSRTTAFLENYDVETIISVDGPEEVHDMHRPFSDDIPSWSRIWNGINLFSSEYRQKFLSLSAVYNDDIEPEKLDVFLARMKEYGISNWNINVNNLLIIQEPEAVAHNLIALRQHARIKYGITISGRWGAPVFLMRAGIREGGTCSASLRNRIFIQPDGSLSFCDYDPHVKGNIEALHTYIDEVRQERNRYFLGNWDGCRGCMLEGFCSPCVLEHEVIHAGDAQFQDRKCAFLRECSKLLLFE